MLLGAARSVEKYILWTVEDTQVLLQIAIFLVKDSLGVPHGSLMVPSVV